MPGARASRYRVYGVIGLHIGNYPKIAQDNPHLGRAKPAQPSFIPSANSYRLFLLQVHGRTHFFEFLCATSNNCDSGSLRFGLYVRRGDGVMSMGKREKPQPASWAEPGELGTECRVSRNRRATDGRRRGYKRPLPSTPPLQHNKEVYYGSSSR